MGPTITAFRSPLDRKLALEGLNTALFGQSATSFAMMIGRFSILRKIGEGGMGVVYLGYDDDLNRKAAVKLLHGDASEPRARKRMLQEAQALARLSHPNVVTIYEFGIHEGELFIAMEFIAGHTLREALRDRSYTRIEVLRMLDQAGRGLAAAHAAGLIHRDFKPDNIMVAENGQVKVMDFGLVRPLETTPSPDRKIQSTSEQLLIEDDPSNLTLTGTFVGTPAYMAPEQHLRQPVDARSDQFSFCVVLWEALCGCHPYPTGSGSELAQAVLEERRIDPPRTPGIPRWLRTIIERGLAREPELRWPSMDALLAALARDPSRRRKRAALGLTLAVGLTGLGWGASEFLDRDESGSPLCANMDTQLNQVWNPERRASLIQAFHATQLSYALDTSQRVTAALDTYASTWTEARTEACWATVRGTQSEQLLDRRMACLDARLLHVETLVDVFCSADAAIVEESTEAVARLPSIDHCADVDALLAEVPKPEDPHLADQVDRLQQRLTRAVALHEVGQRNESLELTEGTLAEARTLAHEPTISLAHTLIARIHRREGHFELAEQHYRPAYESAIASHMHDEASFIASDLLTLTGIDLNRSEDSKNWAFHARPLADAASTDAQAAFHAATCTLARSESRFEESLDHARQALDLFETIHGPMGLPVAAALNNLGLTYYRSGARELARPYHERALAIHEQVLGPHHPAVAISLHNLSAIVFELGDYPEARAQLERAVEILVASYGLDHVMVGPAVSNLGLVALQQGEYEEADRRLSHALAIADRSGITNYYYVGLLNNLAITALKQGDSAEARSLLERALEISALHLDPKHPTVVGAVDSLAKVELELELFEDAREHYRQALTDFEATFGDHHPVLASPLTGLGRTHLALGQPADALGPLERALLLHTANPGEPVYLGDTHFALARALWTAPARNGRDQARSHKLGRLARDNYLASGKPSVKELAQVEQWLLTHPSPTPLGVQAH